MKILAINSSFKGAKGSTSFLIDKIFKGARRNGADCEKINLSELRINRCIDCQTCQKPNHFLKCIFHDKDDVAMVFDKIREADIIMFGTPVYTLGMSSLLKILIERTYSTCDISKFNISDSGLFFHHIDKDISKKPFVPLILCDNLESATPKTIKYFFENYAKFTDSKIAGTLIRNSASLFFSSKNNNDSNPTISSIENSFIMAGEELATLGVISKMTMKKACQPLIKVPIFVKPLLKLGLGREKVKANYYKMVKSNFER